mgnify:CR=1 FL=1
MNYTPQDLRPGYGSEWSAAKSKGGSHNFLAGLKDKRTLTYSALYFGLVCGIYGLGLWMPTIVAALGKFSTAQVGFIVLIPYSIAAVFVYFWSKRYLEAHSLAALMDSPRSGRPSSAPRLRPARRSRPCRSPP